MGWSSGSNLARKLIGSIQAHFHSEAFRRRQVYYDLIDAFEDADCDTLDECLGIDPAFDKMYEEIQQRREE